MLSSATFPKNVLPSKKDKEPPGVVEPDGFVVTAAVNVTVEPKLAGFTSAANVVLVEMPSSSKR